MEQAFDALTSISMEYETRLQDPDLPPRQRRIYEDHLAAIDDVIERLVSLAEMRIMCDYTPIEDICLDQPPLPLSFVG